MDIMTILMFVGGVAALVYGADLLVRGASQLAVAVGISPLVVGLTVVAFGTSTPELGVSVMSSYAGQGGIALGNVVGSNICNVLLILGLSALAAPLAVSRQLIRLEVPLMIGVSLLTWGLAADGRIGQLDGLLLFAGVVCYTVWAIRCSRRETRRQEEDEFSAEFGEPAGAAAGHWSRQLLLVLAGLGLLGLGANWLVTGAVTLARVLGVSDLLIGLTVVAIGTSLPELATSVAASLRGHRDIAVGNVVGSNLFNLMAVLGLTAVVAPAGVPVAAEALAFDLPVMVLVALVCLPVFFTGSRIGRREGLLFLVYYVSYTVFLVFEAQGHVLLPALKAGLLWVVFPLTLIGLAVSVAKAMTGRK